jgi:hypothetical protein
MRLGDQQTRRHGLLMVEQDVQASQSQLELALTCMQERHPLLRSHLLYESDEVYFVIPDPDDQSSLQARPIEWEANSQTRCRSEAMLVLEQFANHKFNFDEKNLLWKLKVVEFEENGAAKLAMGILVAGFCTDGINGVALLVEIVNIANAIVKKVECEEMRTRLKVAPDFTVSCEQRGLLTPELKLKLEEAKSKEKTRHEKFLLPEKTFTDENETGAKFIAFKFAKDTTG